MAAAPGEPSPVLVVDDNPDVRESCVMLLRALGYKAVSATQGEEALSLLRGGLRPRVVLLDLQMPVMDGFAFRDEQLGDPAISDVPVIVYSGHYEVERYANRLRCHGYLAKPLDVDRLVALIETVPAPAS